MKMLRHYGKHPSPHEKATLKALVDAMIPKTPQTEKKQGDTKAVGAADYNMDEYQAQSLNQSLSITIFKIFFSIHLARATTKMLDIAAKQLIDMGENKEAVDFDILHKNGEFVAIAQSDRFRAITLLEQLKVNPVRLPIPFWNNRSLILSIIDSINVFSVLRYYSGWSQLGTPYVEMPEKCKTENLPESWRQIGYPGPSKGYHALRGYLVEKFTE